MTGLPPGWKGLAFPWQLCIGTAVAFFTCMLGNQPARVPLRGEGGLETPAGGTN
jgi:hypothetical protein